MSRVTTAFAPTTAPIADAHIAEHARASADVDVVADDRAPTCRSGSLPPIVTCCMTVTRLPIAACGWMTMPYGCGRWRSSGIRQLHVAVEGDAHQPAEHREIAPAEEQQQTGRARIVDVVTGSPRRLAVRRASCATIARSAIGDDVLDGWLASSTTTLRRSAQDATIFAAQSIESSAVHVGLPLGNTSAGASKTSQSAGCGIQGTASARRRAPATSDNAADRRAHRRSSESETISVRRTRLGRMRSQ